MDSSKRKPWKERKSCYLIVWQNCGYFSWAVIYLNFASPYLPPGFKHFGGDSYEIKCCYFQNTRLLGGRYRRTYSQVFWSLIQCSASELCDWGGIIWPLWSGFLIGDILLVMIWLPHIRSHAKNTTKNCILFHSNNANFS